MTPEHKQAAQALGGELAKWTRTLVDEKVAESQAQILELLAGLEKRCAELERRARRNE